MHDTKDETIITYNQWSLRHLPEALSCLCTCNSSRGRLATIYQHPPSSVMEHNVSRLHASGHQVASIKAVHSEPNAAKANMQVDWSPSSVWHVNLVSCWQPTSGYLVNGRVYGDSSRHLLLQWWCSTQPPPPLHPQSVLIPTVDPPSPGGSCSWLQLPLKLAWAVTIQEAQGLTLSKDVGKKYFSEQLSFIHVRHLQDLLFDPPFPFQLVANLARREC